MIINVDYVELGAHAERMSTVASLMTSPPITAARNETIAEVTRRMHDHRVGSVIIVDAGTPIGILTERDILRLAAESSSASNDKSPIVGDVMTTPAESISASTELAVALATMRERGYRHMPEIGRAHV